MRLWLFYLLLFLTGCSGSFYSGSKMLHHGSVHYETLQNIQITRWGETRFTGILALSEGEGGLHYALIDGTGVMLLQAFSDRQGNHETVAPRGPLAKEQLAGFLSEAIARIYLLEPEQAPCSRNVFATLCLQEVNETIKEKTARVAGLTIWKVETAVDTIAQNGNTAESYVRYNQPWLGVTIKLRAMATKE